MPSRHQPTLELQVSCRSGQDENTILVVYQKGMGKCLVKLVNYKKIGGITQEDENLRGGLPESGDRGL